MGTFVNLTARHVRREEDDLEVQFIWPELLKYSKKGEVIIFSCDAHIHLDGAPDGFIVYLKNQKLNTDQERQVKADINASADALRTRFLFE